MSTTEETEASAAISAEGDRDALLDALRPAAKQVGKSTTGPQAFTVLRIRADSTGCFAEASDGTVSVRVPVPFQIGMGEEWEAQVSPRIADVIRAITTGKISITIRDNKMEIRGPGKSKYVLPVYDHAWPTIDFGDSHDWASAPSVDAETVLELARASRFASEGAGARPNLAGVNVRGHDGKSLLAGTDSFRLYTSATNETGIGHDEPVTISTEMIEAMASVFGEKKVHLHASTNTAYAASDDGARVVSRRIDGSFPDPTKITPAASETKHVFQVDRRFFLDSLERLSTFFQGAKPIRLTFDGDEVELLVRTDLGEGQEYVQLKSAAQEGFVIAFNPKHLLDGIRQFDSQELELRFISDTRPMVVRGVGSEKRQFVQSPVRVT